MELFGWRRHHRRRGPRVGGDALREALAAAAEHSDPYTFSYPGTADVDVLAHVCRTPLPHVLYTTFGLSRVHSTVPVAGVQQELSLRTPVTSPLPLQWPADVLSAMASHIRRTGRDILPGHYMELPAGGALAGFSFVADPLLGDVATATGTVRYTYAVGLTGEDLEDALRWDPVKFTGLLGDVFPLGLTDPAREPLRSRPGMRERLEGVMAAEGSSISAVEVKFLDLEPGRIDLDPAGAAALLRGARGRLRLGRPFSLLGKRDGKWVRFSPDAESEAGENHLVVATPPETVAELLAVFDPTPGVRELNTARLSIHVIDPEA